MTKPVLSEHICALIQKARIVSFSTWEEDYPAEAIAYFQAADEERRYLTDDELNHIQQLIPATAASIPIARQLRDRVKEIVDEARGQVLQTFPDITQPGGGLYPAERAEACWRDFWHFLRCMTYGIAGQRTDYTSAAGLTAMNQLYRELRVPLDAMVIGVEGLKAASLKRVNSESGDLTPYFDQLIEPLRQFE